MYIQGHDLTVSEQKPCSNLSYNLCLTLRKKCPNTSFFWSLFACIQTEYGDLLRKSSYSVGIQENTDQKKRCILKLHAV